MNKVRDRCGFTLVEVLIAILIFSISLFVIVPLLFTSVSIDKESYLKVQAQNMLNEKMDQILSENITADGTDPEVSIDGFPFNRNWAIVPGTGNLSNITVTVTYMYRKYGQEDPLKTVRAVVVRGL